MAILPEVPASLTIAGDESYARISTQDQNLDLQIEAVIKAAAKIH